MRLEYRVPFMMAALVCETGCAVDVQPLASSQVPIVYGADDRKEYFEISDFASREVASQSMVALVPRVWLEAGARELPKRAPTLAEALELCSEDRFAQQPAAAFCSGVLVD